jgi:23S rRNA pseudouridine1911/1915/1917 synthase
MEYLMEHTGLISPNSTFSFTIPEDAVNKRLDHYITQQFPLYSRSFFQRVIDDGLIAINGKKAGKPSIPLRLQDVVTVQFPPERQVNPHVLTEKHRDVQIIAQQDHFLVVFKPAGLVVHSPSAQSSMPTLVDWLVTNYAEIGSVGAIDRPGIVHRLDKDTSGIMIIPRTNYAHTVFGEMFSNRTISKTYIAVVHGHPEQMGVIDLPIGRDPRNPTRMTTFPYSAVGKSDAIRTACTNYTVLEYFENHSLVEVRPVTGRTHQIRVHFTSIGHPIVSDPVYGRASHMIKRQALHAQKLSFQFDGATHEFSHEAPADFKTLLSTLKKLSA